MWNTPFSSLLNTVFLSGTIFLGDSDRPRLGSGLLDVLRIRLDSILFLRSLLLLGVPDSECCEASSKLRRAFIALSFYCCTFSWCTFSAMIGKDDGSSCRSTLAVMHQKLAWPSPTRSLLLLGVPDSECCEASSKLRRAFTALSFYCCTFSWCTFSAMIGKDDGSSCRSTLAGMHRKLAWPSPARFVPFLAYSARRMRVG
ncbi:hypothetical protein Tco_1010810 [Tanacetum coccineum]